MKKLIFIFLSNFLVIMAFSTYLEDIQLLKIGVDNECYIKVFNKYYFKILEGEYFDDFYLYQVLNEEILLKDNSGKYIKCKILEKPIYLKDIDLIDIGIKKSQLLTQNTNFKSNELNPENFEKINRKIIKFFFDKCLNLDKKLDLFDENLYLLLELTDNDEKYLKVTKTLSFLYENSNGVLKLISIKKLYNFILNIAFSKNQINFESAIIPEKYKKIIFKMTSEYLKMSKFRVIPMTYYNEAEKKTYLALEEKFYYDVLEEVNLDEIADVFFENRTIQKILLDMFTRLGKNIELRGKDNCKLSLPSSIYFYYIAMQIKNERAKITDYSPEIIKDMILFLYTNDYIYSDSNFLLNDIFQKLKRQNIDIRKTLLPLLNNRTQLSEDKRYRYSKEKINLTQRLINYFYYFELNNEERNKADYFNKSFEFSEFVKNHLSRNQKTRVGFIYPDFKEILIRFVKTSIKKIDKNTGHKFLDMILNPYRFDGFNNFLKEINQIKYDFPENDNRRLILEIFFNYYITIDLEKVFNFSENYILQEETNNDLIIYIFIHSLINNNAEYEKNKTSFSKICDKIDIESKFMLIFNSIILNIDNKNHSKAFQILKIFFTNLMNQKYNYREIQMLQILYYIQNNFEDMIIHFYDDIMIYCEAEFLRNKSIDNRFYFFYRKALISKNEYEKIKYYDSVIQF